MLNCRVEFEKTWFQRVDRLKKTAILAAEMRYGGESGILTWRFYTSLVFSNIPLKQCKIKGSMCFTMGRILTIGTFMEQISDVYRHHRHQANFKHCCSRQA